MSPASLPTLSGLVTSTPTSSKAGFVAKCRIAALPTFRCPLNHAIGFCIHSPSPPRLWDACYATQCFARSGAYNSRSASEEELLFHSGSDSGPESRLIRNRAGGLQVKQAPWFLSPHWPQRSRSWALPTRMTSPIRARSAGRWPNPKSGGPNRSKHRQGSQYRLDIDRRRRVWRLLRLWRSNRHPDA